MGRWLHFGAGPNQLPAPWENLGGDHDIRKRLRFETGRVSRIHCEHVIEHVSFLQGFAFLGECFRVLEPCGVLRLSFPDVTRMLAATELRLLTTADVLGEEMARRERLIQELPAEQRGRGALLALLTSWGHQAAWTRELAAVALLVQGFADVNSVPYGTSPADGHHKSVGERWARLETTVMEAMK
jgi:hypothetical protein